jgi:cytochrome bd ubiquinol oxidase subunit II
MKEGIDMMAMITYSSLQYYWWFIICLLAGFLVFLLFVQGGQTLLHQLASNEDERKLLINTLGRKWEFSFTTLVVFGGTAFASFPLFYSTSFGGAYWAWMLLLFSYIIQAISYEFRKKPNNFFGSGTYEWFLFINGAIGSFILGIIVATLFTGSEFSVNFYNLSDPANPIISRWENNWHGLEALANPWNLVFGICIFFLARILGILYFMNTINHELILRKSKKQLLINAIPFVVTFLIFVIYLLLKDGLLFDEQSQMFFLEEKKYLHNLIEMPLNTILFFSGVVLTLCGIVWPFKKEPAKAILFAGPGIFLVGFSLFALAGFNHTAFYPSTYDMQSSLAIFNASSSYYTLNTMAYVSILIPFVIAYIAYSWFRMNNKPVDEEEMKNESHTY